MPKSSEYIKISGEDEEKLRLVLTIMQEQNGKELSRRKQEPYVSTFSLFLTNKRGDRHHSGANQSKTIIKPLMLIQLKVTQNETKNTLQLNSLITFIHPVKKRKEKKKHN